MSPREVEPDQAATVGPDHAPILSLHWQDVDLDSGLARVRWTLARVQGRLVVSEPKTDKSRRSVPLPAPVVDQLRAHKARRAVERSAAGPAWRDLGAVFATQDGGYLELRNVLRRFEQLARGASCVQGSGYTHFATWPHHP